MAASAKGRASAVFGVGFSFFMMMVSGLMLMIAPKGATAKQIDWHLLGLTRDGWEAVHLATSFAFMLFGLWHLILHWSVIGNFLFGTPMHPRGHRAEGIAMLAIVVLLLLSAILDLPPTSWLIDLNEFFKQRYWLT